MPQIDPVVNYSDILSKLANTGSTTAGINTVGDVQSKFGIDPNLTGNIFGARKRALLGDRSRALRSASSRMSGRVANPEVVFSGVESDFAGQMGNLEASQGAAEMGQQQSLMSTLLNILNGNNAFNMSKMGMESSVLGQKKQEDQYNEQKPGALDDIMSVLAGGTGVLKALKPFGI
jgi:hypothetical protein